jgi:hypothetical protein
MLHGEMWLRLVPKLNAKHAVQVCKPAPFLLAGSRLSEVADHMLVLQGKKGGEAEWRRNRSTLLKSKAIPQIRSGLRSGFCCHHRKDR